MRGSWLDDMSAAPPYSTGASWPFRPLVGRLPHGRACHFLDVVNDREELPLCTHFALTTKCESCPCSGGQQTPVRRCPSAGCRFLAPTAYRTFVACLALDHRARQVVSVGSLLMFDDRELTLRRALGMSETLLPQVTHAAGRERRFGAYVEAFALSGRVTTSAPPRQTLAPAGGSIGRQCRHQHRLLLRLPSSCCCEGRCQRSPSPLRRCLRLAPRLALQPQPARLGNRR